MAKIFFFILSGFLGFGSAWYAANKEPAAPAAPPSVSKEEYDRVLKELWGFTAYRSLVAQTKQSLVAADAKLITAQVEREYRHVEYITRSKFGWTSDATIEVTYDAKYAFGYILGTKEFDLEVTATELIVRIGRPVLLLDPSVRYKSDRILNTGLIIDTKQATIDLMKRLPADEAVRGKKLAAAPEVVAMCEQKLIEHVRTLLSKHPEVKHLPPMRVVYPAAPAAVVKSM